MTQPWNTGGFFYNFCTFLPNSVLQNHLYNLATELSGRNNMYSQGTLYYHAWNGTMICAQKSTVLACMRSAVTCSKKRKDKHLCAHSFLFKLMLLVGMHMQNTVNLLYTTHLLISYQKNLIHKNNLDNTKHWTKITLYSKWLWIKVHKDPCCWSVILIVELLRQFSMVFNNKPAKIGENISVRHL